MVGTTTKAIDREGRIARRSFIRGLVAWELPPMLFELSN
jgi:hypothetical protein